MNEYKYCLLFAPLYADKIVRANPEFIKNEGAFITIRPKVSIVESYSDLQIIKLIMLDNNIRKLNVAAVVGAGFISQVAHLRNLNEIKHVNLVGLAELRPKQAEIVARKFFYFKYINLI